MQGLVGLRRNLRLQFNKTFINAPWFAHLPNADDNNSARFTGRLWGSNEQLLLKHLKHCLRYAKCRIHSFYTYLSNAQCVPGTWDILGINSGKSLPSWTCVPVTETKNYTMTKWNINSMLDDQWVLRRGGRLGCFGVLSFPLMLFFCPGSHTAFSHHVSLVSFSLWQFWIFICFPCLW